ncbi:MAG TPA: sugar transferase [Thermoanaerobaculia bacterium]|nr:sugar transferase [Thermoanaerobaculia bacterium]
MIRYRSLERSLRDLTTIEGDCGIAVLVLYCTVLIRRNFHVPGTEGLLPPEKFPLDAVNFAASAATLVVALAVNGFYNARVSRRHRPMMAAAMLTRVALLALISTIIERPYPRTILFAQPLLEAGLLLGWRRLLTVVLPFSSRNTLLVGTPDETERFLSALRHDMNEIPVKFSGFVTPGPASAGETAIPCLGDIGSEEAQRCLLHAAEVICLDGDAALRLRLFQIRGAGGYLLLPGIADSLLSSTKLGWIGDQPLVEIAARGASGAGAALKRAADILVSALLFTLTAPLLLAIAAAIAVDQGRPLLVWQRRAGRFGRPFKMAKFRTLIAAHSSSATEEPGSAARPLVREGDERVTRVGYWLRRYRLDELPQLANVLRGEMSLVGPRPERIEVHEELLRTVAGFPLRLLVRPGITGLAQVSSEYETDAETKLRYDLTYICAWSLWLDLRISLQSISTVLSGRGL